MAELNQNTIDAIHKISEAIKETDFYLNRFEVSNSFNNKIIIQLDIREKEVI